MGPSRRFVIIICTLSLLKFQELEGVRTRFNWTCAPLFHDLARYQDCGMWHLQMVKDCCGIWANDPSQDCKNIMNFDEMETSLGEKLEDSDIAKLYLAFTFNTRHIDYAVRHIVDRNHQLRVSDAHFYYIPSYLTSILIEEQAYYNEFNEINFVRLTGKTLIMPFLRDFQWKVMIVDTVNKVIRYYDSLDPVLGQRIKRQLATADMNTFLGILEQRNAHVHVTLNDHIDTSGWRLLAAITSDRFSNSNTQNNDYDSGIYILMFINQVLNEALPTLPEVYRQSLINTIINDQPYRPSPELEDRMNYYSPILIDTENGPKISPGCAQQNSLPTH